MRKQVHKTGFFSIINTGFSQAEVQRQYDIGQAYFSLPKEDKGDPRFRCDFTQGNYFGYRAVSQVMLCIIVANCCDEASREDNYEHRSLGQC